MHTSIKIFYPNFETIDLHKCQLFILFSQNAPVIYTIFHNTWNRFICLDFVEVRQTEDFFSCLRKERHLEVRQFKEKYVIYDTPYTTLVPKELWHRELGPSILDLFALSAQTKIPLVDYLASASAYNNYAVSKKQHLSVMKALDNFHYYHIATLLHKAEEEQAASGEAGSVRIHFFTNHFWICAQKEGKVLLIKRCNSLIPEEVAYTIFSISKSFQLPLEHTPVYVKGMIHTEAGGALYETLNKFVQHLHFETLPQSFDYYSGILDFPKHYFSGIFHVALRIFLAHT